MSFDILMPTRLYNVSGQVVGLYVYYNGSLERTIYTMMLMEIKRYHAWES